MFYFFCDVAVDFVDDQTQILATLRKHLHKILHHLQLMTVNCELTILHTHCYHHQETHLFQIFSHRADVMEVYQLAETGTVCVTRHVDYCVLVWHFEKVGLLSD